MELNKEEQRINKIKDEIANTGRELLKLGLVARTWGNISARIDDNHMVISPSGLGYENMEAADVPIQSLDDGSFEGERKPSSEYKIHLAAMNIFKDVNFCIHTHQDYATAVGLTNLNNLKISEKDKELLAGVAIAKYASPGTDELAKNVTKALNSGAHVVLMKSHGVLVAAKDKDDAINKCLLLEKICKKAVEEKIGNSEETEITDKTKKVEIENKPEIFKNLLVFSMPQMQDIARTGGFNAQLDDMAQMLGRSLNSVEFNMGAIKDALEKSDAVLVKDFGCIVKSDNLEDANTLKILIKKAIISNAYCNALRIKEELDPTDCDNMRKFYIESYSKRKDK